MTNRNKDEMTDDELNDLALERGITLTDESREEVLARLDVADKPRARRKTDIDDMTVPELKDYAVWKKIDLGDATRKEDIKAAIELAISPADDEPEDEPETPAPVEEDQPTGSWPTFGGSNA